MAERLDHQLAAAAATVIPDQLSAEQRRRFRSLPAMIMTSGLAATGAFLLSKKKEKPYLDAAEALLDDAAKHARIPMGDNPNTTLNNISKESRHRYAIAEARARMFAVWLARVASARPDKPTPNNQNNGDDADPATAEMGKS